MPHTTTWQPRRLYCLVVFLLLTIAMPAQTGAPNLLQQAVTRAMSGKSGAAVVINVASGKILASYHLETAARRLAMPGSAIKPLTLLALLQAGKLNSSTALVCRRPLTIAGHNFDCTHPDTQQPFDPAMAVAYSCNYFFTTMATRLTPAELRESFLRDGFASPSGLTTNEAAGRVDLAQAQAQLQMQAIGEWGVHVTPLELLRAYQRLAQLSQQQSSMLEPVFAGLAGSVSYGMGRLAQPAAPLQVAGKTGTSLVEEGSWRHGWFAGYAPADKPQIALVVFLEKGRGPTDAARVANSIFAAYAASRGAAQ